MRASRRLAALRLRCSALVALFEPYIRTLVPLATGSCSNLGARANDPIDSKDEEALEVLTTSQKLTHRIAHELKKLFGGRTSYNWSDDGMLFATWELEGSRTKTKKAGQTRKAR